MEYSTPDSKGFLVASSKMELCEEKRLPHSHMVINTLALGHLAYPELCWQVALTFCGLQARKHLKHWHTGDKEAIDFPVIAWDHNSSPAVGNHSTSWTNADNPFLSFLLFVFVCLCFFFFHTDTFYTDKDLRTLCFWMPCRDRLYFYEEFMWFGSKINEASGFEIWTNCYVVWKSISFLSFKMWLFLLIVFQFFSIEGARIDWRFLANIKMHCPIRRIFVFLLSLFLSLYLPSESIQMTTELNDKLTCFELHS